MRAGHIKNGDKCAMPHFPPFSKMSYSVEHFKYEMLCKDLSPNDCRAVLPIVTQSFEALIALYGGDGFDLSLGPQRQGADLNAGARGVGGVEVLLVYFVDGTERFDVGNKNRGFHNVCSRQPL